MYACTCPGVEVLRGSLKLTMVTPPELMAWQSANPLNSIALLASACMHGEGAEAG
jgi:hypothetical protein